MWSRAIVSGLLCLAMATPAAALTPEDARHLLARTGFAPTLEEMAPLLLLERGAAVERVLTQAGAEARLPPPAWVAERALRPESRQGARALDGRKARRKERRREGQALAGWWMRELLTTPTPITERMTLFWHGALPSSRRKVKDPLLLFRQNVLLRRHALGSYRALLHAVTVDAAMLLYLDGARNHREAPNENYARELMELFTVGEGAYTEADVKEAARALTGWTVNRKTGAVVFRPRRHDEGVKNVRGKVGAFGAHALVDALLEDPRTATRLAERLWRHFVSEAPDAAVVEAVARGLRASDYDVRGALRALLNSEAFWASRGRLTKSPVELLVGAARQFELPDVDPETLARMTAQLGQTLFDPPNVKGWPGGTAWVTAASYLARLQALRRLTRLDQPRTRRLADEWLAERPPAQRRSAAVVAQVLAVPPVDVEVLDKNASGALLRQLVLDPAYQVQ